MTRFPLVKICPRLSRYRVLVVASTAVSLVSLLVAFNSPDRTAFLPGATSHGHYQIELECAACHDPFGGVSQESCLECHRAELQRAKDSHPASKFTDPRNAALLSRIDALRCVTCHEEHVPERTSAMDLTVPVDFCAHCHADIAEERPSHVAYDFFSCSSSGCHKFHDNRSLYEDFLLDHLDEPELLALPAVPSRVASAPRPIPTPDFPSHLAPAAETVDEWRASAHASAGANCSDCHGGTRVRAWDDRVSTERCESCHASEVAGFFDGHHGMRPAAGLAAMTPAEARLPMREDAAARELDCNSCHRAHSYDTQRAAVESCLGCHADEHSLAYPGSPHAAAWRREISGAAPANTGVSCATCHLPRRVEIDSGSNRVRVEHDQNDNLRPVEKMLRDACMHCHGAEFALEALADPRLAPSNYDGPPHGKHDTFDLLRSRAARSRSGKGGDVDSN